MKNKTTKLWKLHPKNNNNNITPCGLKEKLYNTQNKFNNKKKKKVDAIIE